MRIAVVGPGAIGGTVAGWLAQDAALSVSVCVRTGFDRLEVETPERTILATPRIVADPADAAVADWVLVATKTYDAEGAARWLERLVGAETRVAVLQNGVEHVERFAPYVDPARIVPAVVDIPAERTAPGRIRQRKDGWMLVPESAGGRAFAALFAGTPIDVRTMADWRSHAWRKLCVNCAGAVSALTLLPGGVAWDDAVAEVMRGMVRECVAVGRAEGADLADDLPDIVVDGYRSAPRDSVNSIHADRLAGRRMETDARNGVIVRRGRAHGIATPRNEMAAALLDAAQAGQSAGQRT